MTLLQVALDCDNKQKAFSIAKKASKHADILEAGTPLIKAENEAQIIKEMRAKFRKDVFADLKTMDTGYFEAVHAFRAGAKYASVLGLSSNETVKGALRAAGKKEVVVDVVGCCDTKKRIRQLKKLGAKNFEIHTAIDEQKKGKRPFTELKKASKIKGINLWAAGGIKASTLEKVMACKPEVVVVGGAITKSNNPSKAAKQIKERISELE